MNKQGGVNLDNTCGVQVLLPKKVITTVNTSYFTLLTQLSIVPTTAIFMI